jgi:hypothetical protein
MARHNGGDTVKAGFYVNLDAWTVTTLSGEGGALPGAPAERYLRVAAPLLIVLAPLMGALYAMFLPFIGIAMVLQYVGGLVVDTVRDTAHAVLAATMPAWRPGVAHLSGDDAKKAEAAEAEAKEPGDTLDAIEKEIESIEREFDERARK